MSTAAVVDSQRSSGPRREASLHVECRSRQEDLTFLRSELTRDPSLASGNEERCPPLLHAVVKEHAACLRILLQHGAQVNEVYEVMGETPLTISVTRSTPEEARILLEHDSSGVNSLCPRNKEPLLVQAVKHGHPGIVEVLLRYGARPNACSIRDEERVPCVFLAVELGSSEIVKMLLESGASLSAHTHFDTHNQLFRHLQFAITEGQVECLRALISYGALRELRKLTLYPNLKHNVAPVVPILGALCQSTCNLEDALAIIDLLHYGGLPLWHADRRDPGLWRKLETLGSNEFARVLLYRVRRVRSQPFTLKALCRLRLQELLGEGYMRNIHRFEVPLSLYPFLRYEVL